MGASDIYKTVNSAFFDLAKSSFTRSPESDDSVEAVVRSPERFFTRPGRDTRSILEAKEEELPLQRGSSGGVGRSARQLPAVDGGGQEAEAAAHGVRDWKWLEAMLVWYLRFNGKKTHGFVFGAFADLLVGLACPHSSSSVSSSSYSSSSTSDSIEIVEMEEAVHQAHV